MSNFMSPAFQEKLAIRLDGRAHRITFTGENNRTTAVESHNMPGMGADRVMPSNHGNRETVDFATPVQDLIWLCNHMVKQQGMAALEQLQDTVKAHADDIPALKEALGQIDAHLPPLMQRYVDAWNTRMGGAVSPIIFREDLNDIVRTFHEAQPEHTAAVGR